MNNMTEKDEEIYIMKYEEWYPKLMEEEERILEKKKKLVKERLERKMKIYFVLDKGFKNFVKIGSSIDPLVRIKELQVGNPRELSLVFFTSKYKEKEIHKKFSKDRIRGEWFEYSANIQSFLKDEMMKEIITELKIKLRKVYNKFKKYELSYPYKNINMFIDDFLELFFIKRKKIKD